MCVPQARWVFILALDLGSLLVVLLLQSVDAMKRLLDLASFLGWLDHFRTDLWAQLDLLLRSELLGLVLLLGAHCPRVL